MKSIDIKEDIIPDLQALVKLYNSVGWYHYTRDLDKLKCGFAHSLKVITAWDGKQLVGLLRAVGDGYTIVYIQDILVLPGYQRQGIGTQLLAYLLDIYKSVRQKVLMTDNQPDTISFYAKNGFVPVETYDGISFVNYTFDDEQSKRQNPDEETKSPCNGVSSTSRSSQQTCRIDTKQQQPGTPSHCHSTLYQSITCST